MDNLRLLEEKNDDWEPRAGGEREFFLALLIPRLLCASLLTKPFAPLKRFPVSRLNLLKRAARRRTVRLSFSRLHQR